VDTPGQFEALGEWFYPNGSLVRIKDSGDDVYRDRGPGIMRLNRRNNAMSPTGLFCCVIPDATSTNKTTCINIGEQINYLTTINCDHKIMHTVLDSPTTNPPNPTTTPSGSKSKI
jgi:hypothetical protein